MNLTEFLDLRHSADLSPAGSRGDASPCYYCLTVLFHPSLASHIYTMFSTATSPYDDLVSTCIPLTAIFCSALTSHPQSKPQTRTSLQRTGLSTWTYATRSLAMARTGKSLVRWDWLRGHWITDAMGLRRARQAVTALQKRLSHRNPNVQIYALEVSLEGHE